MGSTKLNYAVVFVCFIGLGLSIYAYYVELSVESNEKYTAMCDITEHMSCTKAFKSEYGKGFGLVAKFLGKDSMLNKPNSLLGMIFYSMLIVSTLIDWKIVKILAYIATILSNLASLYFAYILTFILYDFCIVCIATYVVNFLNFILMRKIVHQQCSGFEKAKTN